MNILSGLYRPDSGEILIDGSPRTFTDPRQAIDAGIGMVHQHFTLVPAMTVAENVALGTRGRLDLAAVRARVKSLGERTGLAVDPDARVEELPVGDDLPGMLDQHLEQAVLDRGEADLLAAREHLPRLEIDAQVAALELALR